MQTDQLLILGQTNYRNVRKRFGIKVADRRRPTAILGKTGMGKSTLLLNCIVQDIQFGNGVCVIDPHGDLVERALDYVPKNRINETIYFNPADTEYPIGFNVLHHTEAKQRNLVASGVIQVFKKIWGDSWGPRLEYVFRNALLALLEQPGHSLLGVPRLLTDYSFRMRVLRAVKDPVVRRFWTFEFEQYPKVFRTETISPIQNKVGQFLSNPLMRNILGQTKTRFDLLDVMDSGKILLVNLSKGEIGEDNASLLGSLVVTQLYLAALRRTTTPEPLRMDFYLYIDELHAITTDDFPAMLSESRKFRLNIAGMANQFLSQLPDAHMSAILGNAGTIIAFATGSEDAATLSREFTPPFSAHDLQQLPQGQVYVRLSIDGKTSEPFSGETLPSLITRGKGHSRKLIDQTRQRYCNSRSTVEKWITGWLNA